MDMEQGMELLLVVEEKMDANHEKMLAKMSSFHERMIASQDGCLASSNEV
jgi:hypothetical protein